MYEKVFTPLTAVIITKNEEKNIAACIESLDFCNEILILDSDSSDQTCEIAKKLNAKVISSPWLGYAAQKNKATDLAHSEWVLSVDADERVSEELKLEIFEIFSQAKNSEFVAFSCPRKTIHLGKWIRYGGWYPNRMTRLYQKGKGAWIGDELHEKWEAKGKVGVLKSSIIHYSFTDLSDQVLRNDHYSSLGALKLHKSGKKFSLFKLITKSMSKFMETFFLKRGFLDGMAGFIISISAAYSVFLKWSKLWEIEQKKVGSKNG
jgi:glycosyltransferase involved in cell wall biosynthesis